MGRSFIKIYGGPKRVKERNIHGKISKSIRFGWIKKIQKNLADTDIEELLLKISKSVSDVQLQYQLTKSNPNIEDIQHMQMVGKFILKKLIAKYKRSRVPFSWKTARPDDIPAPVEQENDKCWTVALSRVFNAVMKMNGLNFRLSPSEVFDGVSARCNVSMGGAIDKLEHARSFFQQYVKMFVYYRPKLDDEYGNQAFETLIEEKLKVSPIAASFDVLPSFQSWKDGKGLFIPTHQDSAARSFEKFERHVVYLDGHGVEEGIGFWEYLDNFGNKFGEGPGFVKFSRDQGLIREIVVFEVL